MKLQLPDGVVVTAEISPSASQILTHDALLLVAKAHRALDTRRRELLKRREQRQSELDAGRAPDFLA
jgi:malate synthase